MTVLEKRKHAGRPEIGIDIQIVDDLLISGCNGVEVAAYLGIHPDTLYHRIEKDFKISFTDYSAQKRQKGDSMLHAAQFKKAVKDKDNTMLVWLGKNRLRQRDTIQEIEVGGKTLEQFEAFTKMLEARQAKSDLAISDKSSRAETKS